MVFEGRRSHGERGRGCGHRMGKGINMNENGGYVTPLDGSRDTLNEQDVAVEKGKNNALVERMKMGKAKSSPVSAQMCKRRVSSGLLHSGTVLTLQRCGGAFCRPHLSTVSVLGTSFLQIPSMVLFTCHYDWTAPPSLLTYGSQETLTQDLSSLFLWHRHKVGTL